MLILKILMAKINGCEETNKKRKENTKTEFRTI